MSQPYRNYHASGGEAALAATETTPVDPMSGRTQASTGRLYKKSSCSSRLLRVLRVYLRLLTDLLRVLCGSLRSLRSLRSLSIPHDVKRRRRSELLTTVTDESAIAAAAKTGAVSRNGAIAGDAIASGIRMLL